VQACDTRLLKPTTEHANWCREEMALRGVLVHVFVQEHKVMPPLTLACQMAQKSSELHQRAALQAPVDGVMVLRAAFERRDIYDTVGACDLWKKHAATPTILSYTEGGPMKSNGYLYLAPTSALVRGAWVLPGVAPMWLKIDADRVAVTGKERLIV
jgi:hypothetical protein